jgi:hypothetical protein
MLSEKELLLIERVTALIGEKSKYHNLVDIIELLVEMIEKSKA